MDVSILHANQLGWAVKIQLAVANRQGGWQQLTCILVVLLPCGLARLDADGQQSLLARLWAGLSQGSTL